jgi:hypothetical protein
MYRVYFRRTRQGSVYFVVSEAELSATFDRLSRMGIDRNQCRVKRM